MSIINEYRFDTQEGTTLVDYQGNNNGTLAGVTLPTWGKSIDGSIVRDELGFIGTNHSRVELATSDFEYGLTDKFSLCVCFKSSNTPSWTDSIFSVVADSTATHQLRFGFTSTGLLILRLYGTTPTADTYVTGTSDCLDGEWHFGVITYDGSVPEGRVYIDGKRETNVNDYAANGQFYSANSKATIGSTYNGSGYDHDLTGDIAYFANHNVILTEAEIKAITERELLRIQTPPSTYAYDYYAPKNDIQDGLELYIPLNGNSADYSGNGHIQTDTSMTYTEIAADGNPVGVFDGANDYITTDGGIAPVTGNLPFTYSCWFKTGSITEQQSLFDSADGKSGSKGIQSYFYASTLYVVGSKGTNGVNSFSLTCSESFVNDKWYFFVFSWDGTTNTNGVKLSINGSAPQTTTATSTDLAPTSYNLRIGSFANSGGWEFNGEIKDVRIYNKALSATEIDKLYRDTYIS